MLRTFYIVNSEDRRDLEKMINKEVFYSYLTGRMKKDSRKELGFDPVLTQLFEKGKSADRDKLHERQLKRLSNAIEVDREPER